MPYVAHGQTARSLDRTYFIIAHFCPKVKLFAMLFLHKYANQHVTDVYFSVF
jgi:hypothetical protein